MMSSHLATGSRKYYTIIISNHSRLLVLRSVVALRAHEPRVSGAFLTARRVEHLQTLDFFSVNLLALAHSPFIVGYANRLGVCNSWLSWFSTLSRKFCQCARERARCTSLLAPGILFPSYTVYIVYYAFAVCSSPSSRLAFLP
jgi:hypothetical protein